MVLPVAPYGHAVLRKVAVDIEPSYPELSKLIEDMWETMYASNGVGIAAPQVNKSVRLFVVDTIQLVEGFDDEEKRTYKDEKPVKMAFINPHKVEDSGPEWSYNEGCLSIPKVREDIKRQREVTLRWVNEAFEPQEATFSGITARVIQHEYDHLEGKLFIDYLSPLKRRLIKKKLEDITAGKTRTDYKMMRLS